jgi:serine protease
MSGGTKWIRRGLALAGGGVLAAGLVGFPIGPARAAGSGVANPYSPAYGHAYRRGVVPTVGQLARMTRWARTHLSLGVSGLGFGSRILAYGGGVDGIGVTSGTPKVYLVFYGSQWGTQGTDGSGNLTFGNDPDQGAPYVQNLMRGLGTNGELWSGTMTQYCDGKVTTGATSCPAGAAHVGYPTGGALAGVWYDNSAASPSAATGNQLATEAIKAAGHFANTTAASNRYAEYVVLSPHGADPDNYQSNGFCAWHDYNGDTSLTGGAASSPYGDIAFTNMPYVMDVGSSCGQDFVNSNGTLDGYSIVEGHEYAETLTDQNPAGGWTNHKLLSSYSGEETGDECAWISSGSGKAADVATAHGSFAMQSIWSNDTNSCAISHPIVSG